uniref:helix-turn-helix domain-containing protein n=1 Tax=Streptomyces sp. NBC_00998 TaxID=2903712 RepID=UPI002F913BBB|nr:helix-turn-helix domain-containing protein [Streptomyces sp. NBC_00998]
MGRPELPVDYTVKARGHLASALRSIRTGARLTYEELSAATGLSAATLKRATSGRTLPSPETVKVFAEACGGHPARFWKMWLAARIDERGRLRQVRRPTSPALATRPGHLSDALEYFYECAGAPSLRQLQERAGGRHLLPVSSAARLVNREALPASRQQCVAFLTACGVTGRLRERWADAFDRIVLDREGTDPGTLSDLESVLALTMDASGHLLPQGIVRRRDRSQVSDPTGGVRRPRRIRRLDAAQDIAADSERYMRWIAARASPAV